MEGREWARESVFQTSEKILLTFLRHITVLTSVMWLKFSHMVELYLLFLLVFQVKYLGSNQ